MHTREPQVSACLFCNENIFTNTEGGIRLPKISSVRNLNRLFLFFSLLHPFMPSEFSQVAMVFLLDGSAAHVHHCDEVDGRVLGRHPAAEGPPHAAAPGGLIVCVRY